jgi:hypothetical protein
MSRTLLSLSYTIRKTEIRVASAFSFMLDNISHRYTGDRNLTFCETVCCKKINFENKMFTPVKKQKGSTLHIFGILTNMCNVKLQYLNYVQI